MVGRIGRFGRGGGGRSSKPMPEVPTALVNGKKLSTANIGDELTVLYPSVGLTAPTQQARRNTTAISGATGHLYTLAPIDEGTSITFTGTDLAGVAYTTGEVAIPVVPVGTLSVQAMPTIDTSVQPNILSIPTTGSGRGKILVTNTATTFATLADANAAWIAANPNYVGTFSESGNVEFSLTGVTPDGEYHLHTWGGVGDVWHATLNVKNTDPVLSSPVVSHNNGTITYSATVNEPSATIRFVARPSGDAPLTAAQILATTGTTRGNYSYYVGEGNQATLNPPPDTYIIDAIADDGRGNYSAVVSSTSVIVKAAAAALGAPTQLLNSTASSTTYNGSTFTPNLSSNYARFTVALAKTNNVDILPITLTIGGATVTAKGVGAMTGIVTLAIFEAKLSDMPTGAAVLTCGGSAIAAQISVQEYSDVNQTTPSSASSFGLLFTNTAATPSRTTTVANSIVATAVNWKADGTARVPISVTPDGQSGSWSTGTANANDVAVATNSTQHPNIGSVVHTYTPTAGASTNVVTVTAEIFS